MASGVGCRYGRVDVVHFLVWEPDGGSFRKRYDKVWG